MEAHHPHHVTHKKKWTEYLLEFFMLFLAVFLGFVAENIRENVVEAHREKEYMKTMYEDLKTDTTEIGRWIKNAELKIKKYDSAIVMYATQRLSDSVVADIGRLGSFATASADITFTDRTSSQLKSSGAMRLVKNHSLADSITQYWNNTASIKLTYERYENYRIDTRKLGYRIFGIYTSLLNKKELRIIGSRLHKLLNNDSLLVGEYVRNLSNLDGSLEGQYLFLLKKQNTRALSLITFLKKEYHLQNE